MLVVGVGFGWVGHRLARWQRLKAVSALDESALAEFTQLERLELSDTLVSDLTPLAGLTQLKHLYVSSTKVRDLRPLAGLTQVTVYVDAPTEVTIPPELTGRVKPPFRPR